MLSASNEVFQFLYLVDIYSPNSLKHLRSNSSQRCSCCGYTAKENRASQALFRCQGCGYEENADVNAAKNIKTVGQTGMACAANHISGRQQEPAVNHEELLNTAC
jgi:tRNA(Ile2) C34 agmatinyltransferase TiaS